MNSIDLTEMAICCIKKDKVLYIPKKKGFHYHIQYYLELSKCDKDLDGALQNFNIEELLLHSSLIHETINTFLVKEESMCLILNMAPQTTFKTNLFTILVPEEPTFYQEKKLKELKNFSYCFFEFGVYHSKLQYFVSLMKEEDYDKPNIYLIDTYFSEYKNLPRNLN